jgi:hypothetical protein
MSIPAMVVFHFDSALELMTDGIEHELFDLKEMGQLIESCALQSQYASHEFMWRAFKRMLTEGDGENVVGLKGVH